jgi:peptide/nickel transport system permease protein
MIRFLFRRLVSGLVVLFLFQTAVFFLVQLTLPGDFVSHLRLAPDQAEELRTHLGLDLPLWQRYLNYLRDLSRGDFGRSFGFFDVTVPISQVLKETIPATILVFGTGTAIAFLIGQRLGRVIAWRKPGIFSGSVTFSSILLYTSFPPWLAFVLTFLLFDRTGLSQPTYTTLLWREAPQPRSEILTFMVIGLLFIIFDLVVINLIFKRLIRRSLPIPIFLAILLAFWILSWQLAGVFPYAWDIARVATIPFLAYVLLSFGEIALIMRTTMMDAMHEEFVTTARAKGLPDHIVRDKHVARNALLPVVSGLVIRLPYLLTGAVMIEYSLDWEGIGSALFTAIGMQNILQVMGLTLVIGVISLVARLVLDLLHVSLDPRLRSDSQMIRVIR